MAISSINSKISSVTSLPSSANSPLAKKLSTTASQQEASIVKLSSQAKKLSLAQNISQPSPMGSSQPISAPKTTLTSPAPQVPSLPKVFINTYA